MDKDHLHEILRGLPRQRRKLGKGGRNLGIEFHHGRWRRGAPDLAKSLVQQYGYQYTSTPTLITDITNQIEAWSNTHPLVPKPTTWDFTGWIRERRGAKGASSYRPIGSAKKLIRLKDVADYLYNKIGDGKPIDTQVLHAWLKTIPMATDTANTSSLQTTKKRKNIDASNETKEKISMHPTKVPGSTPTQGGGSGGGAARPVPPRSKNRDDDGKSGYKGTHNSGGG